MTLTIKAKLAGSFGALLLIFAASGLLSVLNLRGQHGTVSMLIEHDLPLASLLHKTALQVQLYRKAEKDVLLNIGSRAAQAEYLDKLKALSQSARKSLAEVDKGVREDEDLNEDVRKIAAEAGQAFAAYDDVVLKTSAELAAGTSAMTAQAANAFYAEHKDKMHVTEKNLDALNIRVMKMLIDNQNELASLAKSTEKLLMWSMGFAMLAAIALGFAVLSSITRPLGRVVSFAKAVAGGDLNAQAAGTFSAEMAELKGSIEGMVGTLKVKIAEAEQKGEEAAGESRRARTAAEEAKAATARAERAKAEGMIEAAGQLERVVEVIGSASEELSAQVEQSSRGAEQQSVRVSETAAAMEEMNSTVLEVAKNASRAAESTEAARRKALEGSEAVDRVVAGIGDVRRVSEALREDMTALGKQAEGIGQVMDVISDIADQTNLLALNAAIEAARAGDAGRGFAVVADEVRKLAEKTMAATKEVGEAIRGIQNGTRKNLENVGRAADAVDQATGLAEQSGASLGEIVRMVEEATDQVRSIATASEEQSATSEEINRSVEEINRISGETADAMRQSAQAVGELAGQTQNLRGLIESMKSGG
jgi:methyl-accepting chemotaxis protein